MLHSAVTSGHTSRSSFTGLNPTDISQEAITTKIFLLTVYNTCVHICVPVWDCMCVEVRGQLRRVTSPPIMAPEIDPGWLGLKCKPIYPMSISLALDKLF